MSVKGTVLPFLGAAGKTEHHGFLLAKFLSLFGPFFA